MKAKLRIKTGSLAGRELEIVGKKFVIGRSDSCQLRPKSESVSRKHCILVMREGRLLLQDLGSRNGTYINDKRLPSDKAKVLRDGDVLRVGKLTFDVLIEHGLTEAKRPEVTSVAEAAKRTVEGNSGEGSRMEESDITSWLDEADQIDRVRKLTDPETRHMTLGDGDSTDLTVDGAIPVDDPSAAGGTDKDAKDAKGADAASDDSKFSIPDKKAKPGKLPAGMKMAMKENSRDAADDALKRFFSGR